MKQISNTYSSFPDQVVSDEIKSSMEYGKQVGQAIEGDWFSGTRNGVENLSLIHISEPTRPY